MADIQVIRCDAKDSEIVWKSPLQDYHVGATLIVNEGQEAIFIKNGQILEVYKSGKHVLDTNYRPQSNGLFGKTQISQHQSSVYFVNVERNYILRWGTATSITVRDPKYGVILPLRAYGDITLKVENSKKLLLKFVGVKTYITYEDINQAFRTIVFEKFNNIILSYFEREDVNFVNINKYTSDISIRMDKELEDAFYDYGIELVGVNVAAISVPEDDPSFIRIKRSLAAAKEQEVLAQGKKAEMDILGYSYDKEKLYEVLGKAATTANSGISGDAFNTLVQSVMSGNSDDNHRDNKTDDRETVICDCCGKQVPKARFCFECGNKLYHECGKCKTILPGKSRFCFNCGNPIEEGV